MADTPTKVEDANKKEMETSIPTTTGRDPTDIDSLGYQEVQKPDRGSVTIKSIRLSSLIVVFLFALTLVVGGIFGAIFTAKNLHDNPETFGLLVGYVFITIAALGVFLSYAAKSGKISFTGYRNSVNIRRFDLFIKATIPLLVAGIALMVVIFVAFSIPW